MTSHDAGAITSIARDPVAAGARGSFRTEAAATPLLRVTDLARHYALPRERLFGPRPHVTALAGVSFSLPAGGSLGVVGESGSGKSTLARLVMALDAPSSGTVEWQGRDLHRMPAAELRAARAGFQMVFQDPYGSLDPRQTVARIVAEPLDALPLPGHDRPLPRAEQHERVLQALAEVGLRTSDAARYPHEFSGGQRQRIAIARALVTRPRLIVADEPVSALDVSVQAQVLNLLQDLREQHGIALLLISHDLAVVHQVCDEAMVLHQGRIVERGEPATLFSRPRHPYTQALVSAVPRLAPGAARARRRGKPSA
ncbi:ATP-binding cassette domain-containing protein [Acidovorax sp. Leaf160]|uniref:ATP-binding cassette domain-containing protein n=1 Tax=Acidovorax sp. Leaf160 TaxID=1736280 RepID=UPI0006FF9D29|nr:ATP-binding cassette domain-containing protein [Acidovorax sp. Leaf160]KQR50193.1 peptide ABC transporter ATP-binding protein [Acidovorax sp. Leaf160]